MKENIFNVSIDKLFLVDGNDSISREKKMFSKWQQRRKKLQIVSAMKCARKTSSESKKKVYSSK